VQVHGSVLRDGYADITTLISGKERAMNERYSWLKKLAVVGALVSVLLVWQAGSSGSRSSTAYGKQGDRVMGGVTFQVDADGEASGFYKSCTGIGSSNEIVENKAADAKGAYVVQKMPGRLRVSDVTITRSLTTDTKFWDWRQKVVDGKMKDARKRCTIRMMDQTGKPVTVWELSNAWPSSLIIDSKGGNEQTTEQVVLTHEGVTVQKQ